MTADIKSRYMSLMQRLNVEAKRAEKAFDRLVEGYQTPVRYYHTIDHVNDVLQHLDWAADNVQNIKALPADDRQTFLDSVELAIWYHDIVYDARAHNNEAESARFMMLETERLGIDPATAREAAQAILITAEHANAKTLAEQIIADCDLHVLGVSWEKFAHNSDMIRKEYAHVETELYFETRKRIFNGFLSAGPLYKTKAFADRYEAKARANIERMNQPPAAPKPNTPSL